MRNRASNISPGPGLAPGPGPLAAALLAAWLLLLLAAPVAQAHGVDMAAGLGQAAWVRATYTGGEPMEFAKVRIIDPKGQTHQVGNTDAQGRFAWLADQEGEWTVVAEDGMGHQGETKLRAGQAAPTSQEPAQGGLTSQPAWMRALLGLSFIFWVSGAFFWWRSRSGQGGRRASS